MNLETLRKRANTATPREAAEIIGVNFSTLTTAIHTGALPSRKVKGRRVVDLEDVEAWNLTRKLGRPTEFCEDPVEMARRDGIKLESAQRRLQRRRA